MARSEFSGKSKDPGFYWKCNYISYISTNRRMTIIDRVKSSRPHLAASFLRDLLRGVRGHRRRTVCTLRQKETSGAGRNDQGFQRNPHKTGSTSWAQGSSTAGILKMVTGQ